MNLNGHLNEANKWTTHL